MTCSFGFTGGEQAFTVPDGVTGVQAVAVGGAGGLGYGGPTVGRGAQVSGNLPVTAGQVLYIEVGGEAARGGRFDPGVACNGGWGGGGTSNLGGGGGGASDVRTVATDQDGTLGSRLLVAAGGGGAGSPAGCPGGGGRGGDADTAGGDGPDCDGIEGGGGGGAGTATGGGAAGAGTISIGPGTLGQGGDNGVAGGGGGGLYGGGAGGSADRSGKGGGGGGSSQVPTGGSRVVTSDPARVTISYSVVPPAPVAAAIASTSGRWLPRAGRRAP